MGSPEDLASIVVVQIINIAFIILFVKWLLPDITKYMLGESLERR